MSEVMMTSDAVGESPGSVRPDPARSNCSKAPGAETMTPIIQPIAITQNVLVI
jgi:hypothetical protein